MPFTKNPGFVIFLLLITAVGLLHCSSNTGPLNPQEMNAYLNRLADSLHAEIAVSFYDFSSGQTYGYNDTTLMHAASTMKVPVMIEVFRQAEAGAFSLDDSLLVKNEFRSIVDGSPFTLEVSADGEKNLYSRLGERLPIRELVEEMITYSSNLATNLLIELVDAQNVTATMRELGASRIQVLRGVEDIKAYRNGLNNRTSARDLMLIFRALQENRAASPASCREMIGILKRQHWRTKIPAGLPKEVVVANKTGSITRIDHDAALIYPPSRAPYVLVVLTRGIEDHNQAAAAIAAVSRRIYEQIVSAPEGSGISPQKDSGHEQKGNP